MHLEYEPCPECKTNFNATQAIVIPDTYREGEIKTFPHEAFRLSFSKGSIDTVLLIARVRLIMQLMEGKSAMDLKHALQARLHAHGYTCIS